MKLSLKTPYVKKAVIAEQSEKKAEPKAEKAKPKAPAKAPKAKPNKQQTWRKHFAQQQPADVEPSHKLNLRAQVIRLLLKIQAGQSLAQWQDHALAHVRPADKALFHELTYGVLRHWFALKQISLPLLAVEIEEPAVECALYLGVYQLLATRIADHASIAETVESLKQLGFAHATGLINAVLRRVVRERESLSQQFQQSPNLPSWLAKRLKRDWAAQFHDLAEQLKQPAPLTLRINSRQICREDYVKLLHDAEIQHQLGTLAPMAVVLKQAVHIPQLVGFEQGYFAVQDEHAQLVNQILPDLNQKHIIDACAAPGGKTAHLLQSYTPQRLQAVELDAQRAERITENLNRLKLHQAIELHIADARHWQSDALADVIILDAPCTATGVIRRHPDIRLLRKAEDVAQTVQLQQQILDNLWQQLKVGGQLLYITCSILKAENEQQMIDFFARHADAVERPIQQHWGIPQQYGRQLLPSEGSGDGFYYCLIEKSVP